MANYRRTDRISEEIKRALPEIIRSLKDPRIPSMLSIVEVSVTRDLSYAKVYVSVMGSDKAKKEAIDGLKNAAGYIRREVGERVILRALPEFTFVLDNSIEHGAHINELIHSVMDKD